MVADAADPEEAASHAAESAPAASFCALGEVRVLRHLHLPEEWVAFAQDVVAVALRERVPVHGQAGGVGGDDGDRPSPSCPNTPPRFSKPRNPSGGSRTRLGARRLHPALALRDEARAERVVHEELLPRHARRFLRGVVPSDGVLEALLQVGDLRRRRRARRRHLRWRAAADAAGTEPSEASGEEPLTDASEASAPASGSSSRSSASATTSRTIARAAAASVAPASAAAADSAPPPATATAPSAPADASRPSRNAATARARRPRRGCAPPSSRTARRARRRARRGPTR